MPEDVLQRILRQIEIANEPDQRRQRPTRLVAKHLFKSGRHDVRCPDLPAQSDQV
jgi:hypothetical protein